VTPRRPQFLALLVVLAAVAVTGAGCGSDGAGSATARTTAAAAGHQGWQRIVPGGDCQCSDGSEFRFWVREANPEKVVFYLQGGGGCFSAETCANREIYQARVDGNPSEESGIFDFTEARNPFADYSVVYVPYCTGDVHVGNATRTYASGLTIQHKGYVNGSAALDQLAETFPGATEVVVVGESAGSIAAPLYAGLVSDRLPDARVTVFADGSGSYPDVPRVHEIFAVWGFGKVVPDWPENAGLSPEDWSPAALFIQSGRHDPEIVFARRDYAYDVNQAFWYPYLGIAGMDPLSLMDGNEAQIERAGVKLLTYTAPGAEHTVFGDGPFYTQTVEGVKLIDWVTSLIEGDAVDDGEGLIDWLTRLIEGDHPVDDVHCKNCRVR
jgi:Pectinacetylesterase